MPKLFPTWSRHSTETGELLRSSVDLIHYDCYTNGINKGKIAILKLNFHPSSFGHPYRLSPTWKPTVGVHMCGCIFFFFEWVCVFVCVPPPCNSYKVISIFQAQYTMSSDCNILHGLKTTTWALKFDSLLFSIGCVHQLALIKHPNLV